MKQIPPPDWAPKPGIEMDGLTNAEYAAIQAHRGQLLGVVHQELEEYLNAQGLYSEGESFPDRLRMTGEYYIGSENYLRQGTTGWIQISIMCRCLEGPKNGLHRHDDYLGLEVWLRCLPGKLLLFDVFRNTDSSAI